MEKDIVGAVALEQLEINPMPLTKGFQVLPSLSLTKHRFDIIQMGFLKIKLFLPSFYIFSLIFTYFPDYLLIFLIQYFNILSIFSLTVELKVIKFSISFSFESIKISS